MTDKILVFVMCSSMIEGESIARALVDQRLAACGTVGARVRSYFAWKGERDEATEYPLVLKTRTDKFAALEAEVRRLHSYELPEIIAIAAEQGSARYLAWIDDVLDGDELRGVWGAGHESPSRHE
jgi:periplasmic divalent cation tolerance protein